MNAGAFSFSIKQGTQDEWRRVFFLSGGINIVCGVFFIIFADAEVQEWAKTENKNKQETVKEEMTHEEKNIDKGIMNGGFIDPEKSNSTRL